MSTNALPLPTSKGRRISVTALSVLVAAVFLLAGSTKLYGTAKMVEMFTKIGFGQWFRYLTGSLEIIGGIGLLTRRYAFYAALLLVPVMVGAVITHLAVIGGNPAAAIVLLVLSATIAYLRKP